MDPITREEKLMAGEQLEPITRKEYFLAKAAGMEVETPEPITREEMFLSMISGGGTGGSGPVIESLTVTENGTYNVPEGVDGYNPVTVEVASGGGGGMKFTRGEFTPSEDIAIDNDSPYTITHALGVMPDLFLLTTMAATGGSVNGLRTYIVKSNPLWERYVEYYAVGAYDSVNSIAKCLTNSGRRTNDELNRTETTISVIRYTDSHLPTPCLSSGVTYYWFAIKFE